MYYFIMISLTAIFCFGLYNIYRLHQIKAQKQLEKKSKQKRLAQIQILKEQEKLKFAHKKLRLEYEHKNKKYQLNTHAIKLLLFDAKRDLRKFLQAYQLIIVKNYWINEPFYSKFYQILLLFEKNELMIIDLDAKVITMSLRDYNNEVKTSKAYEVYNSGEIIESIIRINMQKILQYRKKDAQNIVIAICIFVLEKSVYYFSKEVPWSIIDNLLNDYVHTMEIRKIVESIKEKNSPLQFISYAFEMALNTTETYPYNDSEVRKQLQLLQKLPQKFLQEL